MSADDRTKLAAKHPVVCIGGHQHSRADRFFHWLLTTSELGSALILADTALEATADYSGDPELGVKLRYALQGAEITATVTEAWHELGGAVDYCMIWEGWAFITVKESTLTRRTIGPLPAVAFQVVGARHPDRIPGWRQAMGEAIIAFEEGRTNVSILLANIAVETMYSSIADRRLRRRGMSDQLIVDLHGKLPFEWRLRKSFANAFSLPCLSDAPFWSDWLRLARRPRNPLAHGWRYERSRISQATAEEARDALFLHLKAILHLDPRAFDWLMKMEAKAARSKPGR